MDYTWYTFNVMVNGKCEQRCNQHPLAGDLPTIEIDDAGYAYLPCPGDSPESAHMIKELT